MCVCERESSVSRIRQIEREMRRGRRKEGVYLLDDYNVLFPTPSMHKGVAYGAEDGLRGLR